ncbi:hypothetical protein EJ04DRAFT_493425 [Polyplosphaeria fusca]|uniref:Rhodopsin domain-containing protein n=1 Tax=Polyplosphaeria fusca TaxID=682080 RepID=A0A9P4R0C9_9PLEO|nr:hypothetical protein EJ04DRAFT_493425 [Polyplosphaeria fusca]
MGVVGRHIEVVMMEAPRNLVIWHKFIKIEDLLILSANAFTKLAVLALYRRIFLERSYRIAIMITEVLIVLTYVAGVLTSFFICWPYAYNWNPAIEGGHCGNIPASYCWIGIPNLVGDILILVLPMPAIRQLQCSAPVKVGLFLTFSTGSIGMIAGFIRTVQWFTFDWSADQTFKYRVICMIEPGFYLIAACMLSLQPLKRALFGDRSITGLFVFGSHRSTEKVSWRYSRAVRPGEVGHVVDSRSSSTQQFLRSRDSV